MSLVLGWGAYAWAKNTSAILCAKRTGGGLCARGAYLQDTTVYVVILRDTLWTPTDSSMFSGAESLFPHLHSQ